MAAAKPDPKPKYIQEEGKDVCGIVMPISAMGDYSASHWEDVLSVVKEAITAAGMAPRMVSDSIDSVIQTSIVNNIFHNRVVICDTSGLNPNVMFELGLRVATGKPVIVIHDEEVKPPFDITTVKYIKYDVGLPIHQTRKFIEQITLRINELIGEGDGHQGIIKSLGPIQVVDIETESVPEEKYIIEQLKDISLEIKRLRAASPGAHLTEWSRSVATNELRRRSTTISSFELVMARHSEVSRKMIYESIDWIPPARIHFSLDNSGESVRCLIDIAGEYDMKRVFEALGDVPGVLSITYH